MVSPIGGFGRSIPLMQAAGAPPAGGGSTPASPMSIHDGVIFVSELGWATILNTTGKKTGTTSQDKVTFLPRLGATLHRSLGRVYSLSQLEEKAKKISGMTGDKIKQAAIALDPAFLKESISICLDNIATGKNSKLGVGNNYYMDALYTMLGSQYRGGAKQVDLIPDVIGALRNVRAHAASNVRVYAANLDAEADKLTKKYPLKFTPVAASSSASAAVLAAYPSRAVELAKEIVRMKAKQAGEVLTDSQVDERAAAFLASDYKGYEDYPSTLVEKLQADVDILKQKLTEDEKKKAEEDSKQLSGYFLANVSHTGGPNGEKNAAGEDRTGMAGLTLAGGVDWNFSKLFGFSLEAYYSGGKTAPNNGVPQSFHYFGAQNKTTGSGFAVSQAAFTAKIPLVEKKLTLDLNLGITDPDARGGVSAGKVLGLSGTTYSLAKYSPISSSPLGAYFNLTWQVSSAVTMHLSGAAGKLPEYNIDNAAKPVAAADSAGADVISKELRAGLQWAANPDAPKAGHLVGAQGQFYNDGEKTSYGAYGTAQFYLTPALAVQASGRLFSLDDGQSSDMAGYAALKYNLSGGSALSAYTSYVKRTKDEKGATSGVAAIDASGETVPNDGVMTDTSATSITQLGGEFKFAATSKLSLTGVAGMLRTNPMAGSEESANWRTFLSAGLMYNF